MMQPLVLDKNFDAVLVIDFYESFIWTERYSKAGDFQLYLPASTELLEQIKVGYYLYLEESDRLMIIETIKIETNARTGNRLRITGRSLEMLLARRIVWSMTTLDGYLDGQIRKLLNENIISPTDTNRRIANFSYQTTSDSIITAMQIKSQYTGDNIYDVVTSICDERKIGFKVIFERTGNGFVFSLYAGKDRSYDQTANEPVEFSPSFDNLIDSNYMYQDLNYRSMALIAGMDQAENRKRTTVFVDQSTGIDRKELYIDARDLRQEEGTSDADYLAALAQRATEKLSEYKIESSFEGTMETTLSQTFNKDYFLGDIVYVENEYGLGSKCRVTELIRSSSQEGYKEYPTFEMI